jgi:hypothetical protein
VSKSFETFRNIGNCAISNLTQKEPSCFNGSVSVVKYRVTVEVIEEPVEVLQERVRKLWRETKNMHHWMPLQNEAKKLGFELDRNELGKDVV